MCIQLHRSVRRLHKMSRNNLLCGIWALIIHYGVCQLTDSSRGPSFHVEPLAVVQFSNSTGTSIHCSANGYPIPSISWIDSKGSPVSSIEDLRIVDNGTIIFKPFLPRDFRPDVHASFLQCEASNVFGRIVSRMVRINAVIDQNFDVILDNQRAYRGNSIVMRCIIPSQVSSFVTVTSWLIDSTINVYPAPELDGKYVMLPSGELVISDLSQRDGKSEFQCRSLSKLTGKTQPSTARGKINIVESRATSPPRIIRQPALLKIKSGEPMVLYCIAMGSPLPKISWMVQQSPGNWIPFQSSGHEGGKAMGPLLSFLTTDVSLPTTYACKANNTAGSDWAEFQVSITVPLSVIASPVHQQVDQGGRTEVNCTVSTNKNSVVSVQWYRNGMILKQSKRILFRSSASFQTLEISDFEPSDKGSYQCLVTTDDEAVQASAAVALGGTLPKLMGTFSGQTHHPGTPVSIGCRAHGNPLPTISWSLDDQPLPLADRITFGHYIEDHEVISFVNVSSVSVAEGGTYRCKAENRVGSQSHFAVINVYGLPYIRPIPRQSAVAGKSFTIKCPASGYPLTKFYWFKGGQQLPFNRHQTVFPNGTLVIKELQPISDGGTYSCTVHGTGGETASRTVDIDILVAPKIVPFQPIDAISVGSRATVVCSVSEGDTPLAINWFKDNRPLLTGNGVSVHVFGEFNSFLTIESIQPIHSGMYSCRTVNAAGEAEHTVAITVNVPPSWKIEPQDVRLLEGEISRLSCVAQGSPQPTVTWKKMSDRSQDTEDIPWSILDTSGVTVNANGTLVFSPSRKIHAGSYLCEASNNLGPGLNKIIKVEVSVPARASVSSEEIRVPLGGSATLSCSVSGDPPLEVSWKTDRMLIQYSGHRISTMVKARQDGLVISDLNINLAVKDDTKIYTCVGINSFGRDEKDIQLLVQEPPDSPRHLQVEEVTSRSVKLDWSPAEDGNSPVRQYKLQYKLVSAPWPPKPQQILLADSEVSSWARDLQPGTSYSFRLIASNALGDSMPSEELEVTTLTEPPSKPPTNLNVLPLSSTSLRVTWDSPSRDSWYSESLKFRLIVKESGSQNETILLFDPLASPYGPFDSNIDGLNSYSKYFVVIQAGNDAGFGPNSTVITARTLENVPEVAPLEFACFSQSSTSLRVTWLSVPSKKLRGQLIGYKLLIEEAEPVLTEPDSEERPFNTNYGTLTGLLSNTKYILRVAASTQIGRGPYSDHVMCKTAEDVPEPVAGLKVLASSSGSIVASWLPPLKPNGFLIGYAFYLRTVDPIGWNSKTVDPQGEPTSDREVLRWKVSAESYHLSIGGLVSGGKYQSWVAPQTKAGEGPAVRTVTISLSPPSIPKIVTLGRDIIAFFRRSIVIDCVGIGRPDMARSWTKNGEAIVNSDRYNVKPNGSLVISDARRLDRGNFTCRVQSKGLEDMITHVINVLVPPSPPIVSVASAFSTGLSYAFRLDETGGAVPLAFLVNFKMDGGDWNETKIGRRERTITFQNLRCGTRYHMRIAATNVAGVGASNDVVRSSTSGGVPVAPSSDVFLQPNVTGVVMKMEKFKDGGCPLTGIDIAYKKAGQNIWISGGLLPMESKENYLSGLDSGTEYSLRTIARNEAGTTETLYNFQTLNILERSDNTGNTDTAVVSSSVSYSLSDIRIILSLVISCVAVTSVIIGAFLLCIKRRQQVQETRRNSVHSYLPSEASGQISDREKFYSTLRKQSEQMELQRKLGKPEEVEDAYCDISPYATFQLRDLPSNVTSMYGNIQLSNNQKRAFPPETLLPGYSTNPPILPERQASLRKEILCSARLKSKDIYNMSTYPLRPNRGTDESEDYGEKCPEKRDRRKRRRQTRSDEVTKFDTQDSIRPPSRFLDESEICDGESDMRYSSREERFVVAV